MALIDYVHEWDPKVDKKTIDEAFKTVQADKIVDKRVRAKVVDMYVDMGREGIRLIQMAVGTVQDGGMGHQTLMLINSASPERLLWRLASISLSYASTREGTNDQRKQWERRARSLGEVGVNMTLGAKLSSTPPQTENIDASTEGQKTNENVQGLQAKKASK